VLEVAKTLLAAVMQWQQFGSSDIIVSSSQMWFHHQTAMQRNRNGPSQAMLTLCIQLLFTLV
jgi:hypothetical protein